MSSSDVGPPAEAEPAKSSSDSYERCVASSERVAWTVEKVLGGRRFDLSLELLPDSLARSAEAPGLDARERLLLNHIRAASYMHVFSFFEELVPPLMLKLAAGTPHDGKTRRRSLLRFTEEELKHQLLFKQAGGLLQEQLGAPLEHVGGADNVSKTANENDPLAVILLLAAFEWMTQSHYLAFVHENHSEERDPLFGEILRVHWVEEAQHAKIDELEIRGMLPRVTSDARERALSQLFLLAGAVLELVGEQMRLDVLTLERLCGRAFTDSERDALIEQQTRVGQYTFLGMGLEHPSFLSLLQAVSLDARVAVEGLVSQLAC